MSHELVPITRGLARAEARSTSRELARLDSRGQYQLARIEQEANLQVARVEAIAYVGKQALHAVAYVSQTEQQLAQLCPLAASRLEAIGDITAMSIAEVVTDTCRQVR